MENELINNLTNEEDVELIYATTNFKNDKMFINYTVICDVDNIVSNITLCKKIIATMEVIKELLSKMNISFSYTIKTTKELDQKLAEDSEKTIRKINKSEVLYCKDNSFYTQIANENNKKYRRA